MKTSILKRCYAIVLLAFSMSSVSGYCSAETAPNQMVVYGLEVFEVSKPIQLPQIIKASQGQANEVVTKVLDSSEVRLVASITQDVFFNESIQARTSEYDRGAATDEQGNKLPTSEATDYTFTFYPVHGKERTENVLSKVTVDQQVQNSAASSTVSTTRELAIGDTQVTTWSSGGHNYVLLATVHQVKVLEE